MVKQNINALRKPDEPIHAWYRFVLSFPPHLVRKYVASFTLHKSSTVLDPFCGTGTTLVEAKKSGINSIGIEAMPLAHFASAVKVDWTPSPDAMRRVANSLVAQSAAVSENKIETSLRRLEPNEDKLLITGSINPLPLHKVLVLRDALLELDPSTSDCRSHLMLALAQTAVHVASNLRFGPEVGVGKLKADAPVLEDWGTTVNRMADDLTIYQTLPAGDSRVIRADSREIPNEIEDSSIDAVITSPPYPNEKDYSRTTRLESVLLGFLKDNTELREVKRSLVRSNTRGTYIGDRDHEWLKDDSEVHDIAKEIERRRVSMGKNSGFEKMYHKVTKEYFGGMTRHLADLRRALAPNAKLAYVVGDQASYLRVKIKTGEILAEIARSLGYKIESIDLFRKRKATATKDELREEVVVMSWTR